MSIPASNDEITRTFLQDRQKEHCKDIERIESLKLRKAFAKRVYLQIVNYNMVYNVYAHLYTGAKNCTESE